MSFHHTDRSGAPSTNPVLGPEWLAKDTKRETLLHSDGVLNPNSSGSQSPRTLGRSRSQPLFEDVPKGRNDVSVFSMIQERNTFDRNFPTLNPSTRKTSYGNLTSSAWTQPKKTNTPPKSPPSDELEPPAPRLRHSTGNTRDSVVYNAPVPIPPPSVKSARTSRELLLLPGKKRETPKIPRHFDMSVLRKATSDPNLPMPVTEYDNVIVTPPVKMAVPKKKEKPNNDGGLNANSDRNDFFQDLIRKEAKLKKEGNSGGMRKLMMTSNSNVNKLDEAEEEEEENPPPSVPPPVLEVPPPPPDTPKTEVEPSTTTRKKSSSFSIEDEERFLRNLGWTPQEEDPIPELTSEEIIAVKNIVEKNKKGMKWPQRAAQTVL